MVVGKDVVERPRVFVLDSGLFVAVLVLVIVLCHPHCPSLP